MLDLIRGKSVGEARAILQFTERGAAHEVGKVLDSAIANAGPTTTSRPKSSSSPPASPTRARRCALPAPARGRASRIRKRTTHITVIVGRYSATELEALRERTGRRGRTRRRGRRAVPAGRPQPSGPGRRGRRRAGDRRGHRHGHDRRRTGDREVTDDDGRRRHRPVDDRRSTPRPPTPTTSTRPPRPTPTTSPKPTRRRRRSRDDDKDA